MAKKTREVLKFVRKTNGSEILFAVVGMPERTVGPKETAHYILFSGNKYNRYKMKINTITYKEIDGKKVINTVTPNFEEVKGKELETMYSKCCSSFKESFKLKQPCQTICQQHEYFQQIIYLRELVQQPTLKKQTYKQHITYVKVIKTKIS